MNELDKAEALIWAKVPELIDDWTVKCAAPAWDIKQAASLVFTGGDVGYYWHPETDQARIYYRGPEEHQAEDIARCAAAASRAVGDDHFTGMLSPSDLDRSWVKVAYSPALRRAGELLNFFPGRYAEGLPNAPSPLAATLSGGLVGAGLGYGAGWLGEKILPRNWERGKLRKTLAMLGGMAGAAPGAVWGGLEASKQGLGGWTDGSLLSDPPGSPAKLDLAPSPYEKPAADLEFIPLNKRYTDAVDQFTKLAYGEFTYGADTGLVGIDVNALGQTLWHEGASPQSAATTMGAVYAAQQLPDPNGRPGYVTPHQTGLLGMMMGAAGGGLKGYVVGSLVGKTLGLLTGMPETTQNMLSTGGAALGVVDAVVSKLFQ